MADDPFEDLLELEDGFYKEGYDAGVTDSEYAGLIEGKGFGIEKGYEKALELGKLHGRARVWNNRLGDSGEPQEANNTITPAESYGRGEPRSSLSPLHETIGELGSLPKNSRLRKHIENLLVLTDRKTLAVDNSDEAVTDFDDHIAKAKAKAKIISNIVGESLHPTATKNSGIEDATGLNARS